MPIATDNFTYVPLADAIERTPGELTAIRRAHANNGGDVILLARAKVGRAPVAVTYFYHYDERAKEATIAVDDLMKERGGAAMKAAAEIGVLSLTTGVLPMVALTSLAGSVRVTRAEALKAPSRTDPALKDPATLRTMLTSNVTLDGLTDLAVMTANLNTEANQSRSVDAEPMQMLRFRFTRRR